MSLAALASVVECIEPVPMFQIASVTVTVTDIDMNRDCIRLDQAESASKALCGILHTWVSEVHGIGLLVQ